MQWLRDSASSSFATGAVSPSSWGATTAVWAPTHTPIKIPAIFLEKVRRRKTPLSVEEIKRKCAKHASLFYHKVGFPPPNIIVASSNVTSLQHFVQPDQTSLEFDENGRPHREAWAHHFTGLYTLGQIPQLTEFGWAISLQHESLAIWPWPEIHTRSREKRFGLHNEKGPAVKWDKGEEWFLRGVSVPKWLVDTPTEELNFGHLNKLINAEQRRMLLDKADIKTLISQSGKDSLRIIDDQWDERGYRVIQVTVKATGRWGADQQRRALQMRNPSTGDVHVEWVPPDVGTIKEALKYRNGGLDEPIILT